MIAKILKVASRCDKLKWMDFFSHGIWAGLAAGAANQKLNNEKPLKIKWAAFWGVFPDLLAFTLPFALLFIGLVSGSLDLSDLPRPEEVEPARPDTFWVFRFTSFAYSAGHSFFVFAVVFGLAFLIFRRPIWEMGGWFLHILVDIPTHSYQFYPTPFLWPLSDWKLDGFSWANPPFMILNISSMIVVFLFLRKSRK